MSSGLPARHRAAGSRTRGGVAGRIRIGLVATTAATGIAFAAGPAQAAVNFDPSCPYTPSNGTGACGFVGKGDVQAALGYNNDRMQKNAANLKFTWSQPSSQALTQPATQSASQTASQAGTESVGQSLSESVSQAITRLVSCTIDGHQRTSYLYGSRDGTRTGNRTGEQTGTRTGTRAGSRTGSRIGSRSGTVSGAVSYTIDYDARVKNQIDGFFLTKATSNGFVASGSPVWGDYAFGDYSWGAFAWGAYSWAGDYAWGDPQWDTPTWSDTAWGGWNNDDGTPGTPKCLGGNPEVTHLVDTTVPDGDLIAGTPEEGALTPLGVTDGDVNPGDVVDGTITPGDVLYGAVTSSGPAKLYVNGVALS